MYYLSSSNIEKLILWWHLAYENNNRIEYDKCLKYYEKYIGSVIEIYRCYKLTCSSNFQRFPYNSIIYLPEKCCNITTGIIEVAYRKKDVLNICGGSLIIAQYVFEHLHGEKVEDLYNDLLRHYKEHFIDGVE